MLDHELRALVSVDPSPDFQMRVRAGVKAEPARVWWWPGLPLAALAAAAVAAVAVTLLEAPNGAGRAAAPPSNLIAVRHTAAQFAPIAQPVSPDRPQGPGRIAARRPSVTPAAVQLDRSETLALQRLFASAWSATVSDASEPWHGPIVIPEIVIDPLVEDRTTEGASR